jgi:hypothetical protein
VRTSASYIEENEGNKKRKEDTKASNGRAGEGNRRHVYDGRIERKGKKRGGTVRTDGHKRTIGRKDWAEARETKGQKGTIDFSHQ